MSQVAITVTSTYRKDAATLRPQAATINGRSCLVISKRAFRRVESRISYAGDDGIDRSSIPTVPGYGYWDELDGIRAQRLGLQRGDIIAWAL